MARKRPKCEGDTEMCRGKAVGKFKSPEKGETDEFDLCLACLALLRGAGIKLVEATND